MIIFSGKVLSAVVGCLLVEMFARGAFCATGQQADLAAKIDPLFKPIVQNQWPGAAVLVARDGAIIFEKGYGFAQVEAQVPMTPETRCRIGSVTKQFTAATILKLAEQGRLSFDDRLSKLIPDWPRGDTVTLRNLLTHTSGIHNYTDKPGFYDHVTEPISLGDLIASFEKDPYDFNPGEKYSYSNSDYVLLGYVVEKVTGQSFGTYLQTAFFRPLGMNHTGVYRRGMSVTGEALGYSYENGTVRRAADWDMSKVAAAGSLYSIAHDLYLWNEALFNHRVLSDASLKAAFTVGLLTNDDPAHPEENGYGMGWTIDRLNGTREISHGGELWGFGSYLLRLPAYHLTVVVLLNCAPHLPNIQQWVMAREIARRVMGSELPDEAAPKVVALAPADLAAVVGKYDLGGGAVMTVVAENNHLFAKITGRPRFEIFPKSDRVFFVSGGNAEATFVRNVKNIVVKAILRQSGDRIDAPRIPN